MLFLVELFSLTFCVFLEYEIGNLRTKLAFHNLVIQTLEMN